MLVFFLVVVIVAAAAFALFMVMVMLVFFLVVVIVAAAAFALFMMMVMLVFLLFLVMMARLLGQADQLLLQGSGMLHRLYQLCTGELIPGSGDQGSGGVMLPDQGNGGVQLLLRDVAGAAQDDGSGGFDLVIVEFAEVAHVDLAFSSVCHGHGIAQLHGLAGDLPDGAQNIAELAHAGRLDQNAVRMVLLDHLRQGFAEIAHQGAADTAGVHLPDFDAGFLQKATVNADLAEFVFDQDKLLILVSFRDHLADQRGFSGAQKAGVHINFCQVKHLPYFFR